MPDVGQTRDYVALTLFLNRQPIVGVLLAWLMLGETIGAAGLIGGATVLPGVALTTWRSRATGALPSKRRGTWNTGGRGPARPPPD